MKFSEIKIGMQFSSKDQLDVPVIECIDIIDKTATFKWLYRREEFKITEDSFNVSNWEEA